MAGLTLSTKSTSLYCLMYLIRCSSFTAKSDYICEYNFGSIMQKTQSSSQHKETWGENAIGPDVLLVSPCGPAGRVDSMVIDSDVSNYTLSSLFPATEYEISLNAVRGSQESKVVSTSVFTGRGLIREALLNFFWIQQNQR